MTPLLRILVPLLVAASAFGDSADLVLIGSSPRQFLLSFVLVNHGPDPAKNVVVTMDVPEGLAIGSARVGSHPCDTSVRPVRCEVGDLHVGLPANYSGVELVAPIADATWTASVTVTSDTPDPNPDNQTLAGTWTTKIEADMFVHVSPRIDRVDPGAVINHSWYVCNNIQGNALPRDVRVDFTVTNGVFETIKVPETFTCAIDGGTATCTSAEFTGRCAWDPELTVRTSSDRKGGEARVTARVSSSVPERNPENDYSEAATPVYRWLAVENTADSGPGSLRHAIEQANELCSPGPCRIVFEIPPPVPAEGWFTITPVAPLPDITADRVRIEGSRQSQLTGPTNVKGPEIAIDGRLAGRGLKMLAGCEGLVEGLAIGNFAEDQGLWIDTNGYNTPRCRGMRGSDQVQVTFNHIGVDPSGSVPWPNLRGLRADGMAGSIVFNRIAFNRRAGVWMWRGGAYFVNNFIEHNGAAGVFLGPESAAGFLGNRINGNAEMGVGIMRGARSIDIRNNSMKDNGGLGIDWDLDGVSPVDADDRNGPSNAPVILYGYYDVESNTTVVAVFVNSAPLGSGQGALNFYTNEAAGGDGESHVGQVFAKPNELVLASIRGDHRGKWINATWTRSQSFEFGPWKTSELSNTIRIE